MKKASAMGWDCGQVKVGEKKDIRALPGCSSLQHHPMADGILP
jgi:hypothetical protein